MIEDFLSIYVDTNFSFDQIYLVLTLVNALFVFIYFVFKAYAFYSSYKNNKIILEDIEDGIQFSKLQNEIEILKNHSTLAAILSAGYHKYIFRKNNGLDLSSSILFAHNGMMEEYYRKKEYFLKNIYIYDYSFYLNIVLGFIFCIKSLIMNSSDNEVFFANFSISLKYVLFSMIFGFIYLLFSYFSKTLIHNDFLKIKFNIFVYLNFLESINKKNKKEEV